MDPSDSGGHGPRTTVRDAARDETARTKRFAVGTFIGILPQRKLRPSDGLGLHVSDRFMLPAFGQFGQGMGQVTGFAA
jgi:hypothetical protein